MALGSALPWPQDDLNIISLGQRQTGREEKQLLHERSGRGAFFARGRGSYCWRYYKKVIRDVHDLGGGDRQVDAHVQVWR